MMRSSTITTNKDEAGKFEIEIFDHAKPKFVIVCSHGNGVRRWDGEEFFHRVAEHFVDAAVLLVDQNQPEGDGVKINPLPILVSRVDGLIDLAQTRYPNIPTIVIAHSMGCGVTTQINLNNVAAVFFVTPGVGSPTTFLIERYGNDISKGKLTKTSDGLTKIITAEFFQSVEDINWDEEYQKLVQRYSPVYVFEAEDDEILGEGRFAHRNIPFTSYEVIPGAKHNFSGQPLADLFQKMDGFLVNIKADQRNY